MDRDNFDRKLGLLTDAEQQLDLLRDAVAAAKSSARAAWTATIIALVAVAISFLALAKSCSGGEGRDAPVHSSANSGETAAGDR